MADNTTLNPGLSGDIIRDIDRTGTGSPKTQVVALDFGGSGATAEIIGPAALVNQFNAGTNPNAVPIPVQPAAANFIFSANGTGNSTTTQLVGGGSFLGAVESLLSQPAISIDLVCDQPLKIVILSYIDAAGTQLCGTITEYIPANSGFNEAYTFNGNYARVQIFNQSPIATTTLVLSTAYGTISPVTNMGNSPVSLNEINGVATDPVNGIPVNVKSHPSISVQELQSSQNSEGASAVFLTGDPSGDLRGVDLMSSLVDPSSGINLNVTQPPFKFDSNNSLIPSEGVVIPLNSKATQTVDFDVTGYQSFQIISGSSGSITVNHVLPNSATMTAIALSFTTNGVITYITNGSVGANSSNWFPCLSNKIRLTLTSTIGASLILRQSQIPPIFSNIWGISGTAISANTVSLPSILNGSSLSDSCTVGVQLTPTTPSPLNIKAAAGRLYLLHIGNPNSSAVYVKCFNATSVSLGTTSATNSFYIPATTSININLGDKGLYYNTGIQIAVTGGSSLTDNTAITTACSLNYSFI